MSNISRFRLLVLVLLLTVALAGAMPVHADPGVYIVRPGDTLFSIGRRFGVNPYAIASLNHISNPNLIFVGQRLCIPEGKPSPHQEPPRQPPHEEPKHEQTVYVPKRLPDPWTPIAAPVLSPPPAYQTQVPAGVQVRAWMSNAEPSCGSYVQVIGSFQRAGAGVQDVPMMVTWYTNLGAEMLCDSYTGFDGMARCSRFLTFATPGQYIRVDVTFAYRGQVYSTSTGFRAR